MKLRRGRDHYCVNLLLLYQRFEIAVVMFDFQVIGQSACGLKFNIRDRH